MKDLRVQYYHVRQNKFPLSSASENVLSCLLCIKNQVFTSSQMKERPLSSHWPLRADPWCIGLFARRHAVHSVLRPHNCLAPRPCTLHSHCGGGSGWGCTQGNVGHQGHWHEASVQCSLCTPAWCRMPHLAAPCLVRINDILQSYMHSLHSLTFRICFLENSCMQH